MALSSALAESLGLCAFTPSASSDPRQGLCATRASTCMSGAADTTSVAAAAISSAGWAGAAPAPDWSSRQEHSGATASDAAASADEDAGWLLLLLLLLLRACARDRRAARPRCMRCIASTACSFRSVTRKVLREPWPRSIRWTMTAAFCYGGVGCKGQGSLGWGSEDKGSPL